MQPRFILGGRAFDSERELFADGPQTNTSRRVCVRVDQKQGTIEDVFVVDNVSDFVEEHKQHVLDLGTDSTLLPGLVDCHTHPCLWGEDYQFNGLRSSSAYKALVALKRVDSMLRCGWTTIRVAGDSDAAFPIMDVKKAIDSGLHTGPRIHGAGHYLSITGGGGDINSLAFTESLSSCQCSHRDGMIVDGVEEMRKAVRTEIKYGSDWIKLLVSGAYMDTNSDPTHVHFSDDELHMGVDESAKFGVPVMAHAHSAKAIVAALKAGVRSIEHGSFIDAQGIALMKKQGAFLVPTLYIGEHFNEHASKDGPLGKMLKIQEETDEKSFACLRAAVQGGVRLCVGTDYVGWDPVLNYRELTLLHDKLALSAPQVLEAATKNGGLLLGTNVGRLAKGYVADIIATVGDSSPIDDIAAFERHGVSFVMHNGCMK